MYVKCIYQTCIKAALPDFVQLWKSSSGSVLVVVFWLFLELHFSGLRCLIMIYIQYISPTYTFFNFKLFVHKPTKK